MVIWSKDMDLARVFENISIALVMSGLVIFFSGQPSELIFYDGSRGWVAFVFIAMGFGYMFVSRWHFRRSDETKSKSESDMNGKQIRRYQN